MKTFIEYCKSADQIIEATQQTNEELLDEKFLDDTRMKIKNYQASKTKDIGWIRNEVQSLVRDMEETSKVLGQAQKDFAQAIRSKDDSIYEKHGKFAKILDEYRKKEEKQRSLLVTLTTRQIELERK